MAAKQSAHCSHTVQRGKKHRRQQKNTFLPFPPNLCLTCGVVLLVLQLLFIFGCGSRQFVLYYAHILCIYANLRPTRIAFYGGLVFNLSTQSQNAYCGYEHRRKSHFTNERACVWLVCVCFVFSLHFHQINRIVVVVPGFTTDSSPHSSLTSTSFHVYIF